MVRGAPKKNEEEELPRNDELNILTAIWKWVTELFFPNEHIKTYLPTKMLTKLILQCTCTS